MSENKDLLTLWELFRLELGDRRATYSKYLFWKVKKELDGLYDMMQPKALTDEDKKEILEELFGEEGENEGK